jgi:hypothetical protein
LHDRDGAPERAWVFGLSPDGRRTLVVTDVDDVLKVLESEEVLGSTVTVRRGSLLSIA